MTTPDDLAPPPPWETGKHGDYSWVATTTFGIDDLLAACPSVLLNKFVAVTSCDNGPLPLNEQSKALGWEALDGIAYGPQISSSEMFPYHVHFDEWYVFCEAAEFARIKHASPPPETMEIFVNYYFRFGDPEMQDLTMKMWQQLEQLRPESYIAEADWGWLTFITRNQEVFARVVATLQDRGRAT